MAKFFSPITNAIRGKSTGLLAAYSVAGLGVILIAVAAYYGYAVHGLVLTPINSRTSLKMSRSIHCSGVRLRLVR